MRDRLLRLLKVPERPAPPPGADASLEVFRASPRFFGYSILAWALKQFFGFLAIIGPLAALDELAYASMAGLQVAWKVLEASLPGLGLDPEVVARVVLSGIEAFAIVAYLVQLVVSGLLLKLGWELRWYMVSDSSLRIREGLVRLREQTLRVANIQNMVIKQGPIQRLFGISDLEVHTAGGGGKKSEDGEGGDKRAHVGRFRGLDDAVAVRDRIQRALSKYRGAGLGESDERPAAAAAAQRSPAGDPRAARAGRELLAEARRLRAAISEAATS